MKFLALTPALASLLLTFIAGTSAHPILQELSTRELLNELDTRALLDINFNEVERRGLSFSKPSKQDPDRKAKWDTGNPKPETPKGEFRQFTAGKKDDYFGDWQTQVNGVHNPAAGKGKKSKRGAGFSKPSKQDPDRKAKWDTGNPKPETPKGEFRQFTAGKKDDYFGDWQTQVNGVHNPAAGKGKKSKRGAGFSKPAKQDPDRKAKWDTGNPKPETPKGEFRQFTAGKKDDYFGDWQTQVNGVHNPAAGKGKKSKRGLSFSKPAKQDPDRKAKWDTGNPKPETPKGEFRQFTAGKKDDYFGDWQTQVNGVHNPAAGKGKKSKRDLFEFDEGFF